MISDRSGWPAIGTELHEWHRDDTVLTSRAARRRHLGPYEAAVVPPLAGLDVQLPSEVLAHVDEAGQEIARFDAELGHEIAPFATILLRSESSASSKIEHLTASARAIAEAELGHGGRNASLVVANQRAMTAAIELAERIDPAAVLQMHAALLDSSRPDIAGTWRTEQVWIGGSDVGPHAADFVPPHHQHVPTLIDDLVAFIARDDVPALAHAALAHAQFETIHPFADGNGRTGRALVHAHLRSKGLTRNVTIPVSAGLLVNVDTYFAALTSFRAGDPVPIVERFADAAFAAVQNGRQLADELRALRTEWNTRIRVRRDAAAWRLADVVLRHPVVNATLVADELGVGQNNAYRAIEPLVAAEVLVEFTNNKRDRLWRAPEVLAALDAFAARIGRRSRPS